MENGQWEPETLDLLDRLLKPGDCFVDVGAWIGPTSLYAAARGAHVVAYECDPVALRLLHRNLELNSELAQLITVHEFALGESDGQVRLWSQALGNSESSVFAGHERDGDVLACDDSAMVEVRDARSVFDAECYAASESTLIKIDVEGSEFQLLPHLASVLANSLAVWYVSFHELNINPPGVPPGPARIEMMLASLSAVADLYWYDATLAQLDREATVRAVKEGSWPPHASLIFSRRPLVW
jgi:FkbM family methyltransferase